MKTFKIYQNELTKEIIAIKDGFSIGAFFFGWIYALIKKQYLLALVFLVVGALVNSVGYFLATNGHWLGLVILYCPSVGFLFGAKWSDWYANALLKKGFVQKTSLNSANENMALMQYAQQF